MSAHFNTVDGEKPSVTVARFESHQEGTFAFEQPATNLDIFGAQIAIEPMRYTLGPARLEIPEPGRTDFIAAKSPTAVLKIIGLPTAVFTTSPLDLL